MEIEDLKKLIEEEKKITAKEILQNEKEVGEVETIGKLEDHFYLIKTPHSDSNGMMWSAW
ncbi:hypothetical protein [Archaeoglobus sp.]